MDTTRTSPIGGEPISEIDSLLTQTMAALSGNRPDDARVSLDKAYLLLVQGIKDGETYLSIVSLQCVSMALNARSADLARGFAELVVDEVGRELERLGRLHSEQVQRGDEEGVRQTEERAYTYAVTFIPFVERARRVNLLASNPTLANGNEVAAISVLQKQVKPLLDKAGWGSWSYDAATVTRAKYWSAAALMHSANTLLVNQDSGEDIEIVLEMFEGACLLIEGFPDDRVTCDLWNVGDASPGRSVTIIMAML